MPARRSSKRKSIPISEQARVALGLAEGVEKLSPPELKKAILLAPVDLLWNGGIGTYVKASSESNAEVGDRANDAIRVTGAALRCRVVGEGGNLGLTQLGRTLRPLMEAMAAWGDETQELITEANDTENRVH